MKLLLSFLLLFLSVHCFSQDGYVKGIVKNDSGESMSLVSVFVEENGEGSFTDKDGSYSMKLKNGEYTLMFTYLGFSPQSIRVKVNNNIEKLDVVIQKSSVNLEYAEIIADSRDRAREIMKKVREYRSITSAQVIDFEVSSYQLIHLESVLMRPNRADTISYNERFDLAKDQEVFFKNEMLELTENLGKVYYKKGKGFKEIISATKTHKGGEIPEDIGRELTAGGSIEFGENIITPQFEGESNPWVLIQGTEVLEIDLYRTLINIPALTEKPILSPLASTSAIAYKFDYLGTELVNDEQHYKIQVTPLNKFENSFSGIIWFTKDTYKIGKADLTISGGNLHFAKSFNVKTEFDNRGKGSLITSQIIEYAIQNERRDINTRIVTEMSEYSTNTGLEDVDFNREIKIYSPEAFDRDQSFWDISRALSLDSASLQYIQKSDSVANYLESEEYLSKIDSAFNKVNIWTPIVGYGRRNREKGNEFYIEGILGQMVPLGIGGYRHKLPGYFEKEFKNDFKLKTSGFLDYGFNNKDLKGKITVGFTYNPKKFVRTQVKFGDFYDMVNNFASLEQTFSRSNYIRTKMLGLSQRMEVVNGLYAEVSFDYQDQLPLDNLEFSEWSTELFGELNEPIDFERYVKTEIGLQMEYRIRQKYYFKKNRKIVLPSKFPLLTLQYRKGINKLFGSEVDFDYLEIGAKQEIEVGRFGSTRWEAQLGSFLNQKDLRVLEYKFFRGSDELFFSDPLRSFQLLGATLNTPNEYLRANVIHHFEGTILNKIPLIRRLQMGLAAGGGTLSIPDSKFYHVEFFGGVEKSFRLFKEMLRGGIYGVTSDNTLGSSSFTWKVGLSFYSPFNRKWDY